MTAGRVLIGRILKAHGIRGEVSFAAAGDDPGSLRPGLVAYLGAGRGGADGEPGIEATGETLTIRGVRAVDRFWLLSFDEVADREVAESLAGRSLFVDEESMPPLPEGEYYHFQLVGLAVTRPDGMEMGRVTRVIDMPGHDLLEVQGREGDFLVPIRREFVEWIDLERGEIRLADRADLLEAQSKTAVPDGGGDPAGRRKMKMRAERRRKLRPDRSSESTS
jgi:16S rRNA processing protein RimM